MRFLSCPGSKLGPLAGNGSGSSKAVSVAHARVCSVKRKRDYDMGKNLTAPVVRCHYKAANNCDSFYCSKPD